MLAEKARKPNSHVYKKSFVFLKISNSSVKKKLCSMTVRKCLQHESYDLTFQNSRQSDIKIKSLIEP